VNRAINELIELLVVEAVDDAKKSVGHSRRRERTCTVSSVRRCAKLSEVESGMVRSQPNTPPTKKRRDNSARTLGGGRRTRSPVRRRNSASVIPPRVRGKSTTHTSCSGTPVRNAWTRSGSRSNSSRAICISAVSVRRILLHSGVDEPPCTFDRGLGAVVDDLAVHEDRPI
jgi:hypothetical protein